jgi:squalene-associated FAD-dependent desaturase
MSETARPRVAVVGGGLAGLTAALACADAGAAVTLFEAKKWLGGATSSFERDGLTIDTGQHVFLRCCTAYRGFLDRLGVADRTTLQRRMDIPVLSSNGRAARLRRNGFPAPLHLAPALAGYRHLSPADRFRSVRGALALRRLDPLDPTLDVQTFGSWLRAHGQSERSIRYLWDLFGLPTLNLPADQASLALAAKVFRTGLLERNDAADIGIPAVSLSDLHGRPAETELRAAGAEIRLGSKVRQVLAGPDGVSGVAGDEGTIDADAVIVAVPNDRVAAVLPEGALPDREGPARLGLSPIVNVHVVYDRPVTSLPFAAAVDTPVQWVFDRTVPAGLAEGQYLAISLSGAGDVVDEPVEQLRDRFLPALAALFPAAGRAEVRQFLVTRERGATFRQAPGTAAGRPGPETLVPRLFLAGAWTDTGWPATMEGAVRSGLAAARRALVTLGRTERLPAEAAA